MKCAHREEAAYKTKDHSGTKQIWTGAVCTCVVTQSLVTTGLLSPTTKHLCTICSHFSCLARAHQQARTFFFFSPFCTQQHTRFKWNLILPLIVISHTFSIKQLMGGVAGPGSHTGFNTFCFWHCLKHSACVDGLQGKQLSLLRFLEVAGDQMWVFSPLRLFRLVPIISRANKTQK